MAAGALRSPQLLMLSALSLRRSSPKANPPPGKTFGFALILREGEPPETAIRVLGGT